jgi:hypothetical protein
MDREREQQLMSTVPYLEALLELAVEEVRTDGHVDAIGASITRKNRGGIISFDNWKKAKVLQQMNEGFIAEADILHSLITDSSGANAAALAQLTPGEQQAWEGIDFTTPGAVLPPLERTFVRVVIVRAVNSRLQQARAAAINGSNPPVTT